MQVLRLDRNAEAFYGLLGPVFGSRKIEQDTHDRFYDDPGKQWYYLAGQGAASVLGRTIKNFWAADAQSAQALLWEIMQDHSELDGIVPNTFADVYEGLGFHTSPYKKNFIEVYYERD